MSENWDDEYDEPVDVTKPPGPDADPSEWIRYRQARKAAGLPAREPRSNAANNAALEQLRAENEQLKATNVELMQKSYAAEVKETGRKLGISNAHLSLLIKAEKDSNIDLRDEKKLQSLVLEYGLVTEPAEVKDDTPDLSRPFAPVELGGAMPGFRSRIGGTLSEADFHLLSPTEQIEHLSQGGAVENPEGWSR